jgi:hypothetical protein
MKISVTELDIIYLSYDEPNAEENWAHLLTMAPWAKRVKGVKGFDAAHKACANLADTPRFITVDGDNLVDNRFFNVTLDIPEGSKLVYSCNAMNNVNGLCYGNGGIKIWTKEFVLNMQTHEAATNDKEKVDFCWSAQYSQLNNIYSTTVINKSAKQAFRAGFREGVKMFLDRGVLVEPEKVASSYYKNLNKALVWSTVGADADNGLWTIYGTRLGMYKTYVENLDFFQVSDYDWFETLWKSIDVEYQGDVLEINSLGAILSKKLNIAIPEVLSANQSKWYKQVAERVRVAKNPMMTELEFEKHFE